MFRTSWSKYGAPKHHVRERQKNCVVFGLIICREIKLTKLKKNNDRQAGNRIDHQMVKVQSGKNIPTFTVSS